MQTPVYDAIVVGAGPAGSSAAYFLKQEGYSVLLLEKSAFPRDKVCGEFISPAAWKFFKALGVEEAIKKSGYRSVHRAMFYAPSGRSLEIEFAPEHGLGLSRSRLDFILLENAQKSGVDFRGQILMTDCQRNGQGLWEVLGVGKHEKLAEKFSSRAVVFANGKSLNKSLRKDKGMFGFKAHYRGVQGLNGQLELYFFEAGYGGLVQIEEGMANACFLLNFQKVPVHLVAQRPDEFMDWVFKQHPALRQRMKGAERASGLLATGPLPLGLRQGHFMEGAYPVGDALGVIDPFLGEGIALALESSLILSEFFGKGIFEKRIKERLRSRFLLSRAMKVLAGHPFFLNALILALSKNRRVGEYLFRRAHAYSQIPL